MKSFIVGVLCLSLMTMSAQVQAQYSGYCPLCVVPVSGTFVGNGSAITGNSTYQNIFSVTLPAGTFVVGSGIRCWAAWLHNGISSVSYQWKLGSTAFTAQSGSGAADSTDITIFTPSSLSSQTINIGVLFNSTSIASASFQTASEDLSSSKTLTIAFNVGSGDTVTPKTFYCLKIE